MIESRTDAGPPDPIVVLRHALREHYAIGDELGRGAMATVYRARDLRLGRDVAIKVLRPEYAMPIGTERFLREIEFASRLQHPHILPVLDSGAAEGVLYYVMPCVDGRSLRDHLAAEQQLPISEALRIACEVGSALEYAHARGVLHRDIKPANILLSSGVAVVADFGIAHAMAEAGGDRITATGLVVGTPGYMSPEQASGDSRLDARSDVYALGCVLYEMLVGEPPFTGPTPQAILARTLQSPPPAPSIARSSIPPALELVLERALAKVPADRYRTAGAFVEAMRGIETGSNEYKAVRLLRAGPRRKLVAVAGAAALLAAATVALKLATGAGRFDDGKVVVFPPVEHGLPPADTGAAYDVALAISSAFEYVQPLRLIEGWPRLDERTLAARSRIPVETAQRIARDRRARHYLDGDLRRDDAGALVLTLRLNDAEGDSVVVTRTATARQDQYAVQQVAFNAISQILPVLLAPDQKLDLTPLTARHPAAIALWIKGELQYRRARFDSALVFYSLAIEQDSAAAFAALKGAQAASWLKRSADATRLTAIALARSDLLPARHAAFARGFEAYLAGRADTAAAILEQAVAASPEWGEASMALGEVYYHLIPARPSLESLAYAAFSDAERVDPTFTPALVHLAEIAVRRGDVARAEQLVERLRSGTDARRMHRPISLALACVRRPSDLDWDGVARRETALAFSAAELLAGGAAHIDCAKAGFDAVRRAPSLDPGTAWGAMVSLHGLLMATGRHDEALRLVDSTVSAGRSLANLLYILDLWAGAPAESRAAGFDSLARERWGSDYSRLTSLQGRWVLGLWHLWRGDTITVRSIADQLGREADRPGGLRAATLSRALDAHLALKRGDTTHALRQLRVLAPSSHHDSLTWGLAEPLPVERLVLAELLLARREYAEALTVAEGFDHPGPAVYLAFLPRSLVIRHRAAESLGRREEMKRIRSRLDGLGRGEMLDGVVSLTARRN